MLLDLDLRKADVAGRLDVDEPVHLSELLSPDLNLYSLLRTPVSLPSVSVLATELQQGDAILLDPLYERLPRLVSEAREIADHVIIDTPPLGEISDALRLMDHVDDLVVVVRPGNSDRVGLSTTREPARPDRDGGSRLPGRRRYTRANEQLLRVRPPPSRALRRRARAGANLPHAQLT